MVILDTARERVKKHQAERRFANLFECSIPSHRGAAALFPKSHLLVASAIAVLLGLILLTLPESSDALSGSANDNAEAGHDGPVPPVRLPEALQPRVVPVIVPKIATRQTPESGPEDAAWQQEKVRTGDSLARIFQRAGLSANDLHYLMQSGESARRLARIHPGETLHYRTDDQGRLQAMRHELSRLEAIEFKRKAESSIFEVREISREPEVRLVYADGEIDSSLFLAAARSGLGDNQTMALANVFQWDIDFVHDIRPGDRFSVLYEEHWLDGEKVGHGAIVAAEFVNRGTRHKAVRYLHSDGSTGYYTPEGRSMRRAFLRAPVEFSRISSNFNPRRRHPIHDRVMPHRGIDYAAPTGTPVVSAGSGVVTEAGTHHANGNYIIIRHGEQYQTKYLHLHRIAGGVRRGSRVDQGQVIGYVGSSGWATGPHLHYEFMVNGVHQNPRTVDLPKAESIADAERARFEAASAPLLAALNDHQNGNPPGTQVASRDNSNASAADG